MEVVWTNKEILSMLSDETLVKFKKYVQSGKDTKSRISVEEIDHAITERNHHSNELIRPNTEKS